MGERSLLTVEGPLLVVLWLGMASFVAIHSLSLFAGGGEQTLSMFRRLWFVGLGIAAVLAAFTWSLQ